MAQHGAAARRYAQAVFDIAKDTNTLDKWLSDLKAVNAVLGNQDVVSRLEDPKLREEEQRRLITDSLKTISVQPMVINLLYMFHRCSTHLTKEQALAFIGEAGGHNNTAEEILELLVWFGFLGVQEAGEHEPSFAYQVRYNVEKLMAPVDRGKAVLVVNPAFYRALSCTEAH